MRLLFLPLLLLAGCGRDEPQAVPTTEATPAGIAIYAAQGRDRLCLSAKAGEQAGLITFAATGDANCSLRGSWTDGASAAIRPAGDPACTIPIESEGDVVTLGRPTPGCGYYCGPGATFEGKTFVRMDKPAPVTDFAGDPIC